MENLKNRFNFKIKFKSRKIDYFLIFIVVFTCVLGLVTLSSATLSTGSSAQVRRQLISTFLGFFVMITLMLIDYRVWKKFYMLIYIVSIALLFATLLFGHGATTWGAKSWLRIGPLNFQPSEFVKLGLIISLSTLIEKNYLDLNRPLTLLKILIFVAIPIVLILRQPDMGTVMVFIFFIASMLFIAKLDWKYIFSALGLGVMSLPIIYFTLDEYQKKRIFDFLNPSENLSGTGYQANEGRIAVGSGKFLGKGLYNGSQTQFNFIPAKETDYIFAVLVEEFGFLGGFLLILLYGLIIYRLFRISMISKDKMGSLLVVGVLGMLLFHIWENIGMTIGLMPITGIPLPFMSFGGTFQLVNLASIGLVLSVYFHRNKSNI